LASAKALDLFGDLGIELVERTLLALLEISLQDLDAPR